MQLVCWLLSLEGNDWTAIGTWALAGVTGILALIVRGQVQAAREEARKAATIQACNNYEASEVIFQCLKELEAAGELAMRQNPKKYCIYAQTFLNYLDGLAIGVCEKFYEERIVKANFRGVMLRAVERYLDSGIFVRAGFEPEHYTNLVALVQSWKDEPTEAAR